MNAAGQDATGPVLPTGTQVVLRRALTDRSGATVPETATAKVVGRATDGGYVVRTADGREATAGRADLTLRRVHQRVRGVDGLPAPDPHDLVEHRTVHAVVVGSRAFGLDTETSDTDVRGVYVAPTASFWSLRKPPRHVEGPAPERFSWEVERFCELALKANPNLLEVLHSPLVVTRTPLGDELVALRGAFLSRLAYTTYGAYVLSQFKKIEADLRRDGTPRWKHVMHLLRLLLSARDLLRTGVLPLDVGEHRDRLLAVRAGAVPWDEVEAMRIALHADLDAALDTSPLPDAPDTARVDAWLRSVRARDVAAGDPS